MSINIPLGTYVSDGLRSGPFYTGQLPLDIRANNNGVITSRSHSLYGPGILFSPQNTYKITPAAPAALFNSLNNLVAATAVTQARDLVLLGDNKVTFQRNGVVQFDWPRIVTVTTIGADAIPNTRVTIFGEDWYGMPMQHEYLLVAGARTYPEIVRIGAPRAVDLPAKAFYRVNRVHISAALPAGCTMSLGAADAFGLPYAIPAFDMTAVRWGANSEFTLDALLDPLTVKGVFVPAVTVTATQATGDVRGFYVPSEVSDDVTSLSFTSVIQGADVWTNQIANMQQLYRQQNPTLPIQGVAVSYLTPAQLYGVPQFYTGTPRNP